MPSPVFVALAALLALSACASDKIPHTSGEIPRDGNGRPVWSLIEPSGAPRAN